MATPSPSLRVLLKRVNLTLFGIRRISAITDGTSLHLDLHTRTGHCHRLTHTDPTQRRRDLDQLRLFGLESVEGPRL